MFSPIMGLVSVSAVDEMFQSQLIWGKSAVILRLILPCGIPT